MKNLDEIALSLIIERLIRQIKKDLNSSLSERLEYNLKSIIKNTDSISLENLDYFINEMDLNTTLRQSIIKILESENINIS